MIQATEKVQRHVHNGMDAPRIPLEAIQQRVDPVRWNLSGTDAATATNYGVIFIADKECSVSGFHEVHQTAGTDAGAVTIQLEKLTGTQAPDAGTNLLLTALSLKAAINTLQKASLVQNLATKMNAGDRLCLKDTGVLTAVANVSVTVFITYP